jgi:hypothetical protein
MAELPNAVHENAVGVVGVMSQGASRTGLTDRAHAGLIGCQGGEGKGAARRGIGELPNLAPLELGACPKRVLPDHVAYSISDAIDILRIALRVTSFTQTGVSGDGDGGSAILAGCYSAADVLQTRFLDPVPAGNRIDLVGEPIGAVVSKTDLVDDGGRDQVGVTHAHVVAQLGIARS